MKTELVIQESKELEQKIRRQIERENRIQQLEDEDCTILVGNESISYHTDGQQIDPQTKEYIDLRLEQLKEELGSK